MPTKVWAVGEEVLAADFNTYVQEQVVSTFPSVSALKAWTPPNGAHAWVEATSQLYWRRGGAWWTRATFYNASVTLTANGSYDIPAASFGLLSIAGGTATIVWDAAGPPIVGWSTYRMTGGTAPLWATLTVRGWTTNAAGTTTLPAVNATGRTLQAEAFGPIA